MQRTPAIERGCFFYAGLRRARANAVPHERNSTGQRCAALSPQKGADRKLCPQAEHYYSPPLPQAEHYYNSHSPPASYASAVPHKRNGAGHRCAALNPQKGAARKLCPGQSITIAPTLSHSSPRVSRERSPA